MSDPPPPTGAPLTPPPTETPAAPSHESLEVAPPGEPRVRLFGGRIPLRGRSMRQHAARGSIINAAFSVGLITLGLLKGLIVATFLTASEYGVWGILFISMMTITWLKQVGVGDKFIQQSEDDQEYAFQKAFTLEMLFSAGFFLLFLAAIPLFAAIYGRPEIVVPALLMALTLLTTPLQAPLWVFYRKMEFLKQRTLLAIDPVLGFVVTVALAIAGAGYWSLVIGTIVGSAVGALAALIASPYRISLRYDRGTAREYVSFSWPLVIAGGSSLIIAQGSIIVGEAELGLVGAGSITLAATVAHYSDRVDGILTATLYPAICAAGDRTDLLFESFVKSNRLALMWGVPFGVGLSLFATDLVEYGIGEQWRPAIVLFQAFGLTAAAGHIGFNWDAFYRARGNTRPIAIWSSLAMVTFLLVAVPLLMTYGLKGLAIGVGVMTAVSVATRGYYLTKLFSGFQMAKHGARAIAPAVPAVLAVLIVRSFEEGDRTALIAAGELTLFLGVTAAATLLFERELLREMLGYLRRVPGAEPRAAT